MTESDLIINADRNTKKEKIQLPKRKQECCKCHKTFTTELDKRGIPYNRICPKCREENTKVRFGGSKPIFGSAQSRNTGGYND